MESKHEVMVLDEQDLFDPVQQKRLFDHLNIQWKYHPYCIFRGSRCTWYVANEALEPTPSRTALSWIDPGSGTNKFQPLTRLSVSIHKRMEDLPFEFWYIPLNNLVAARDWWNHRRLKELHVCKTQ